MSAARQSPVRRFASSLWNTSQKRLLHRLRMRLMFLRDPVRFAPYYRLSVLLVFSHVTSNIINQQLEQKFQRVIRRKLTAVAHGKYFSHSNYYHLEQ